MKEFLTSPLGIGIIGSLIAAGIVAAIKWGRELARRVWHFLTRFRPRVPRETIRLVPNTHRMWWGFGSISGKPAMQVVGHWHVTNIIDRPVMIPRAFLSRPRTEGLMVLVRQYNGRTFGQYFIPAGATTELSADFWVTPPICREGEDFKAAVSVVDHFGNEHKVKGVVFRGREPKKEGPAGPPEGSMHSIIDPVEVTV